MKMKKRNTAKKTTREKKLDKFFLLSWKKIFFGAIVWISAVVLHNLIYTFITGVLKIEIADEPFFFVIAVIVIPIYFLIAIVYTIMYILKKIQKKRD